jgi:hypothetical protein
MKVLGDKDYKDYLLNVWCRKHLDISLRDNLYSWWIWNFIFTDLLEIGRANEFAAVINASDLLHRITCILFIKIKRNTPVKLKQ